MTPALSAGAERKLALFLSLLGLLLLSVWLGWLLLRGWHVASHLGRIRTLADEAQHYVAAGMGATPASPEEMRSLCDKVWAIDSELDGLAREGGVFLDLAPFLGWIPRYGYDLQSMPQLLSMTRETVASTKTLCEIGTRMLRQTGSEGDTLSVIARTVRDERDGFQVARDELDRALDHRNEIQDWRLSKTLAGYLDAYDRLAEKYSVGLHAAALAPYVLGADGERLFLVIAQNEDELRPTGGFISAAGSVLVADGHVAGLEMADSYSIGDLTKPHPWPPYPLHEYMGADYWLLRDANWSPDFPTTAETAAGLYLVDTGLDVDGVLSVDQAAMEYLLEATGPVEVTTESGGVWVSAQNLIPWMENNWSPAPGEAQGNEWWMQRKTFISELSGAMLQRVESESDLNRMAALQGILRAFQERHILVYLRNPEAAELLYELDWDGHVDRSGGDYFMAVEANVGFNKASRLIERRVDLRVSLDSDGGGEVEAELHYQHESENRVDFCDHSPRYDAAYSAMMDRCYWAYLRLIVPTGAELTGYPPIVVPGAYLVRGRASDGGVAVETINDVRKSWGQLFLLAPGDSTTLEYTYRIPAGTARKLENRWQYRIVLQKQPGLRTLPLSLDVKLPEGMSLFGSDPEPSHVDGHELKYDLNLRGDQVVRIDYGT